MEKLRDIIEWNEEDGLYEKNLIEKVSQYERIVIFGAGIGGHKTLELLKKYGFENIVAAFSDNNERKIGYQVEMNVEDLSKVIKIKFADIIKTEI